MESTTFPRVRDRFQKLVFILWCFLQLCSESDSMNLESRNATHLPSESLEDNPHRTLSNHPAYSRHVRIRDTRRFLPNELTKYPTKQGSVPLLLKRQMSTASPWSTLYQQEYNQHQPTTAFAPFSVPTMPAAPSPHIQNPIIVQPAHRFSPSNQMMTVIKTVGPLSMQDTQSKDFYKNINRTTTTHDDVKRLKDSREDEPESVSETKISYELEDIKLAYDHLLRMRENGRCQVPIAQVVCVKDLYPSATKDYLPRCTLLHRCGDNSGCCDRDELKCVPKAIQEVALNFYAILNSRSEEAHVSSSVEKLLFENHTECECVDTTSQQTSSLAYTTTTTTTTTTPATTTTTTTTTSTATTAPETTSDKELQKDRRSTEMKSLLNPSLCRKCPPPFHIREYMGGRCTCDCFDKQKPCLKIKRGRLPLEEHWRRCVEQLECYNPSCEYGTFDDSTGRCPERPDGHLKLSRKGHMNHRLWEERD